MFNFQYSIILVALLLALPVGTVSAQKEFVMKYVARRDSSGVKGTDPRYIGLPKKGWTVVLNPTFEQMRLTMRSHYSNTAGEYGDNEVDYDTYLKINPRVTSSLGLWVGYHGIGFGYGVSLNGKNGMNMSLNMASSSYGLNVRFRRFHYSNPVFGINNLVINGENLGALMPQQELDLQNPMKITSLVVDGFWIFNKRKFSYSAAYNQSTRQLRSAGSIIAGLMFYFQKYDLKLDFSSSIFSDRNENVGFLAANDIGTFEMYQGSIGLGYTYNWVPGRNWVINVTAMPVLTVVNKLHVHQIDGDFRDDGDITEDDFTLVERESKTNNGGVKLNLDLQMAAVYWHKDWFFKVTGQAHRFQGTYDLVTAKYFDWNAKASVGYTF